VRASILAESMTATSRTGIATADLVVSVYIHFWQVSSYPASGELAAHGNASTEEERRMRVRRSFILTVGVYTALDPVYYIEMSR
jgi:hypothetical protein